MEKSSDSKKTVDSKKERGSKKTRRSGNTGGAKKSGDVKKTGRPEKTGRSKDTRGSKKSGRSRKTDNVKKAGRSKKTGRSRRTGRSKEPGGPSRQELERLYKAAETFRAAAVWDHMSDSDIFGIRDPESGTTGYCCVMGQAGEFYGLAVYLGGEGLAGYFQLGEWEEGDEVEMGLVGLSQKYLIASFESKQDLTRKDLNDLSRIKHLGLDFRGWNGWPLFRRRDPGWEPWYLSAPDAGFLALALEQTLNVAERFRADPDLLQRPLEDQSALVRVLQMEGDSVAGWSETVEPFENQPEQRVDAPEQLCALLADVPAASDLEMEVMHCFMPAPIKKKSSVRGYYPHMLLYVDGTEGLVLGFDTFSPDEFPDELFIKVCSNILEMGRLPHRILVTDEFVWDVLCELLQDVDIEVQLVRSLPAAEQAYASMVERLCM